MTTRLSLTASVISHLPRIPSPSLQRFGLDRNAPIAKADGMPRPSSGAGGLAASLRVVRAETRISTFDPEHLRQSSGRRHTHQAEGEFGIAARNPAARYRTPSEIFDELTVPLLKLEPKYPPPGFTPGSAVPLPLVPPQSGQRYSLVFALGLIPAINLTTWG